MSHRRAKRLRAQFIAEHGRAPGKAQWTEPLQIMNPSTGRLVPVARAVYKNDELKEYAKRA